MDQADHHLWSTGWLETDHDGRLAGDLPSFECEAGAVTGALDDHLVRGVGETIQCAAAEDGVTERVMLPFSLIV